MSRSNQKQKKVEHREMNTVKLSKEVGAEFFTPKAVLSNYAETSVVGNCKAIGNNLSIRLNTSNYRSEYLVMTLPDITICRNSNLSVATIYKSVNASDEDNIQIEKAGAYRLSKSGKSIVIKLLTGRIVSIPTRIIDECLNTSDHVGIIIEYKG
jgi:hypothetical protein